MLWLIKWKVLSCRRSGKTFSFSFDRRHKRFEKFSSILVVLCRRDKIRRHQTKRKQRSSLKREQIIGKRKETNIWSDLREKIVVERFSIGDPSRHGQQIIVAPGLNVVAISDSFGRILVYDIHRGIAVRMFKGRNFLVFSSREKKIFFSKTSGYREAEIGFIQIEEHSSRDSMISSSAKKSALFLVIHAPKRQLVEVRIRREGKRFVSKFSWSVFSIQGLGLSTRRSRWRVQRLEE